MYIFKKIYDSTSIISHEWSSLHSALKDLKIVHNFDKLWRFIEILPPLPQFWLTHFKKDQKRLFYFFASFSKNCDLSTFLSFLEHCNGGDHSPWPFLQDSNLRRSWLHFHFRKLTDSMFLSHLVGFLIRHFFNQNKWENKEWQDEDFFCVVPYNNTIKTRNWCACRRWILFTYVKYLF